MALRGLTIKGRLGIDRDETFALRPELSADATDLGDKGRFQAQRPEEYSNWTLVIEECRARSRIQDFLQNQIDEDAFVIVQIDTGESAAGPHQSTESEGARRRSPESEGVRHLSWPIL